LISFIVMAKEKVKGKNPLDKITKTSNEQEKSSVSSTFAFVICVLGIYASYFCFSVIQQTLNEATFEPDMKKFRNTPFLLFLQFVGNCFCALIAMQITKEKPDQTPFTQYALVSVSYVGAMFASNYAIQFVSFPMKELAKACKPIPVLLMGVIVFGKKQGLLKYICVFLITSGICVYMWDEISHSESTMETSLWGVALLLGSLLLDGITGPFQDELVGKYRPSSQAMMFQTNLWAVIYMGVGLILFGQGITGVQFVNSHPGVIPHILLYSLSSAIGQLFIYYTVNKFGSLVCSLVTTTRKFFSILISSLLFAKPLTNLEWLGVFIVFSGLGIDIYSSSSKRHKKE